MPYVRCPTCETTAYTAARFSTVDECPRCGRPLRAARRTTVAPGSGPAQHDERLHPVGLDQLDLEREVVRSA
jgi:ribosomal protein L34E